MIIKIEPRLSNEDYNISIKDNENLLTSTLYKFILLVDYLYKENQDTIIQVNPKEFDIVISRFMGDELDKYNKSKDIYEFSYDSINAGWFFERATIKGKIFTLEANEKEINEIYGDIFFRIELQNNNNI